MTRFKLFVVLHSLLATGYANAQVLPSGTINVPGTFPSIGDNASIGSNTTLNVSSSSVGDRFSAGTSFGPNTNTKVNITGGRIGSQFLARSNSEVNVSGGSIDIIFGAGNGSTVNVSGGSFGAFFTASSGSEVNVSGGNFDRGFRARAGSQVSLFGGDFLVNGNSAGANVTLGGDDVLSGTLKDGSTFVFSPVASDDILNVQLVSSTLPPINTTPIELSSKNGPRGLRQGQTLTLVDGGELSEYFAAVDAALFIEGGLVRSGLEAARSNVSITGGTVRSVFHVYSGSVATVSDVAVTGSIYGYAGSEVNINGGVVGEFSQAHSGSRFNISGGFVGRFFEVLSGGNIHVSGGSFGRSFEQQLNSSISFYGGGFRLNGSPVAGTTSFAIGSNDLLTGTFEDGSPFVFSQSLGDFLRGVTLIERPVPAIDLTPMVVNSGIGPSGLRHGQSIEVGSDGTLPSNFTAAGATVNVNGGSIGSDVEIIESTFNLREGMIGDGFAAFLDSEINVSGGVVGSAVLISSGSRLNISGGSVGGSNDSGIYAQDGGEINITDGTVGQYVYAGSGGRINISGGSVAGTLFIANAGSLVNISGGSMGQSFDARSGSKVNVFGGSLAPNFDAGAGSEVNLSGNQFILDGIDITGTLSESVPLTITERNVTLSGVLGDGSPFSFDLNSSGSYYTSVFSPNAVLTVTLSPPATVPEPSALLLFVLGSFVGLRTFHVQACTKQNYGMPAFDHTDCGQGQGRDTWDLLREHRE